MERGLVLRQHFFGADSDEVWRACKTVGEMCNLLAMTYLQQEDFAMVLELLKKAEILTERDPPGRAVTFNNLACYYRRYSHLHLRSIPTTSMHAAVPRAAIGRACMCPFSSLCRMICRMIVHACTT